MDTLLPSHSPALARRSSRLRFRGELALCMVAVLNSFAVYMMLYSGAGISSISSVPYVFSLVLPRMSLGTWTYLFQTVLVAVLMLLRRRFVPSYLLAFLVGFAFGKLMDVHALWIAHLPLTPVLRVFYFAVSFAALSLGIALSNHCKLPIIPTDLFPRDLAELTGAPYQKIKTVFDLCCLGVTVILLLAFLGRITGIGVGTVFCALSLGRAVAWVGKRLEKRFVFVSFLAPDAEPSSAGERAGAEGEDPFACC